MEGPRCASARRPPAGGVDFRLWAPGGARCRLALYDPGRAARPGGSGRADAEGWWECHVPQAGAGQLYHWRIDDELNGAGPGLALQTRTACTSPARGRPAGVRLGRAGPAGPGTRSCCTSARRRVHARGHLRGRGGALQELADLGITAIELMPLADFPGRFGWGYDGVLPFAPHHGLRHAGRAQGLHPAGAPARADGVPGRGLQPLRAGRQLPAPLRAAVLLADAQQPLGRGDQLRRAGQPLGARVLHPERVYWTRSTASTACAWMRCMRSPTTAARTCWRNCRRGARSDAGPPRAPGAGEREQRPRAAGHHAGRGPLRRPVERRLPPRAARGADRRDQRLLPRLRHAPDEPPLDLLARCLTHGMLFEDSRRKPGGARETPRATPAIPLGRW
jgi:hypothetical protein